MLRNAPDLVLSTLGLLAKARRLCEGCVTVDLDMTLYIWDMHYLGSFSVSVR